VQPGGHERVAPEAVRAPERRDHRLLERVGGILGVAGRPQGDGPEPVTVPGDEHPEGIRITVAVRLEERGVRELVVGGGHGVASDPGLTTGP
jgi:hypothetical protein